MANASSPRFGSLAGIGGRAAAVALIAMVSSVMFAATPAAACDLLDPTCAVEVVEETVDNGTETVDETVEDVTETVETVEESVESVVGQVDETVDETVDQTVGPGVGPVDDVIGNPSVPNVPDVPDPVSPPTVDPAPPGGGGNGSDGNGPGIDDQPVGAPSGGVAGPFALDPITLASASAGENPPALRGFLDVLAGPAGEIASRIAFPLALALLVFAFVAFQHRLDGRDPKLALAATSPDVLRFG